MGMVSQIAERKREMAAKATHSTSDRRGFIQLRPVPTPCELTPRERDLGLEFVPKRASSFARHQISQAIDPIGRCALERRKGQPFRAGDAYDWFCERVSKL